MSEVIKLAHGFGGTLSQRLLDQVIIPAIRGEGHSVTLDAAVLEEPDD